METEKQKSTHTKKAVGLRHGLGVVPNKQKKEKSFYYKAKELIGQDNINKLWDAGLRIVDKNTIIDYLKLSDPKFYNFITSHSEIS